jgi:hypothetical protein
MFSADEGADVGLGGEIAMDPENRAAFQAMIGLDLGA